MESEDILTKEDISSLFNLKYAKNSSFVMNLPSFNRKDFPMFLEVLEHISGPQNLLPHSRYDLKELLTKKLLEIKENSFIVKWTIHTEYRHVFLRGQMLEELKFVLTNLLDSFFEPLERIPLLINHKLNPISKYVFRCRLEGVLPITEVIKDGYTTFIVLKNF